MKRPAKPKTKPPGSARSKMRAVFTRSGERRFSGYVVDPADPVRRFTVEILVDGYPVRVMRADAVVQELASEGIGDACYGFTFVLDDKALDDSAVVEARLANLGTPVGIPIHLAQEEGQASKGLVRGAIRWLGGLRFAGWVARRDAGETADVIVDGTLVTRVRASAWTHVGRAETDARPVRSLDFHLPERFADGTVHQLELRDDDAETISEQLFFIAYPDGLREAIAGLGISEEEKLRAQLFDQLLPMSAPFSQYQAWRERFAILAGPPARLRAAVILAGPGAADDTLESLKEQTHDNWIAAPLPHSAEPMDVPADTASQFLETEGATCDFVVFALAGTVLEPLALQRIASAFAEHPEAQAVYTDLDLQGDDGSIWPLAFSAFDYERMLEQGYCAHLFALRRDSAMRFLQAGATSLYRLFNSVVDDGLSLASSIVHLPGPLAALPQFDKAAAGAALAAAASAHLQQRKIEAQLTQRPAGVFPIVQITRISELPRTTIVIPTRNRQRLLQDCIDTIEPAVTRAKAELLIVDNDSTDPDALAYLSRLEKRGTTVLRIAGEFNFPRLNNQAAAAARGEVLCLLNNDIKARDDEWLEEMLSRMVDADVGAVGALLLSPSGVVQHAGVVLGPRFAPTHTFTDRIDGDPGYGDLLRVAHECSALTAACLLTRRRDYIAVGGMDEIRFPINFNDVDYCLKVRALGKRVVLSPHAKLVHLESASRGLDVKPHQKARFERELWNLRAKWGNVLADDPYYSPILSLDPVPFSALAWPARAMDARVNTKPLARGVPSGF